MIKLKELLLENITGTITSTDIFNFYFLFYYSQHEPALLNTQFGREMEREYLTAMRNNYLITFKDLMVEQINKYIARGRIDPDFPVKKVTSKMSAQGLADLMAKTFRSDMERRNEVWDVAAQATANLEGITNPKFLYGPINALNMAVHNTHTAILGKLIVGHSLMSAYNACANVDPRYYAGRVSKDLRDILRNPDSGNLFNEAEGKSDMFCSHCGRTILVHQFGDLYFAYCADQISCKATWATRSSKKDALDAVERGEVRRPSIFKK